LPSSVLAKPHCGDSASCSSGRYFAACSIRRFNSSLLSSIPDLLVTSPSTTTLCPRGTKRSGSKPPARSLSYSMKYASALIWLNSTSATGSYPPEATQCERKLPRHRCMLTTMPSVRPSIARFSIPA